MHFIRKLFGLTSSENKTLGKKNIFQFHKIESNDFSVEVGDEVKLWNKPNSDLVNAYAKGFVGGEGLVGQMNNQNIAFHLIKGGLYNATIKEIFNNKILIEIHLINEFKTIEDYKKEQSLRWKNELQKPYNPKKGWTMRFIIENKPSVKGNLKLGFRKLEDLDLGNDRLESNLWLENSDGKVISDKNVSGSVDTIKTLRALYSGKQFTLGYEKKSGIYHYFTLEI